MVVHYVHHWMKKMMLKRHQTTVTFPYMQKYCTGEEFPSYKHKTMCTALCCLRSTDGDLTYWPMYELLWKWRIPEVLKRLTRCFESLEFQKYLRNNGVVWQWKISVQSYLHIVHSFHWSVVSNRFKVIRISKWCSCVL